MTQRGEIKQTNTHTTNTKEMQEKKHRVRFLFQSTKKKRDMTRKRTPAKQQQQQIYEAGFLFYCFQFCFFFLGSVILITFRCWPVFATHRCEVKILLYLLLCFINSREFCKFSSTTEFNLYLYFYITFLLSTPFLSYAHTHTHKRSHKFDG